MTVSKSQLDEVAAGNMTRDELREKAGGYYFNPPPEIPGLGSQASRASRGDLSMTPWGASKARGTVDGRDRSFRIVPLDGLVRAIRLSREADKKGHVKHPDDGDPEGGEKRDNDAERDK